MTPQMVDLTAQQPNFDEIELALDRARAQVGAAEAHGLVSGIICAGTRLDGIAWVEQVLGPIDTSDVVAKESRKLLFQLYEHTNWQLHEMDFTFTLLLPCDEFDLLQRAESLGNWCNGFMAGLGLGGINSDGDNSEDVREALHHLGEFASVDYENIDICEADEKAYAEVVEYVRMSVLMIYSQFTESGGSFGDTSHTYH